MQPWLDGRLESARGKVLMELERITVNKINAGSDAPCVRLRTLQADREEAPSSRVLENGGRPIQVVDDEVEVAVVVEVDAGGPIGEHRLSEAPFGGSIGKREVRIVTKGEVGDRDMRHLFDVV